MCFEVYDEEYRANVFAGKCENGGQIEKRMRYEENLVFKKQLGKQHFVSPTHSTLHASEKESDIFGTLCRILNSPKLWIELQMKRETGLLARQKRVCSFPR